MNNSDWIAQISKNLKERKGKCETKRDGLIEGGANMNNFDRIAQISKKLKERNAKCEAKRDELIKGFATQILDLVEKKISENPNIFIDHIHVVLDLSDDVLNAYAQAIGFSTFQDSCILPLKTALAKELSTDVPNIFMNGSTKVGWSISFDFIPES